MPQKRKQKGSGRPLLVPSLDNKPRYETPDPEQLPTPVATPQAKLPLRLHEATTPLIRANVGARKIDERKIDAIFEELELTMKKSLEEESAQTSCKEGMSGP